MGYLLAAVGGSIATLTVEVLVLRWLSNRLFSDSEDKRVIATETQDEQFNPYWTPF